MVVENRKRRGRGDDVVGGEHRGGRTGFVVVAPAVVIGDFRAAREIHGVVAGRGGELRVARGIGGIGEETPPGPAAGRAVHIAAHVTIGGERRDEGGLARIERGRDDAEKAALAAAEVDQVFAIPRWMRDEVVVCAAAVPRTRGGKSSGRGGRG